MTQAAALIGRNLRARHATAAMLAVVAAGAQAVTVFPAVLPFPREAAWLRPSSIAALLEAISTRGAAGARVHWQHGEEIHWIDKVGQMEGMRFTHDLEPLTPARTARYLNFLETGIPDTLDARDLRRRLAGHASSESSGASGFLGAIPFFGRVGLPADASRSRLFDLASVRFVLAHERPGWLDERFTRVRDLGARPAVFENAEALPRAYLAVSAEPEPDTPEDALARLVAPDFDARHTVLLDAPPADLLGVGGGTATSDSGAAVFERDDPERQVIRTRGERPAVLVVADAFFPGWEATVDGSPAAVLRVNTVFRGVAVPAGEHVVELRYRPASFRVGVALALGALFVVAGCLAHTAWRRRSAR